MQQYNEYFVYMNRHKQEVHDHFFKWIIHFVLSYMLIVACNNLNVEATGFPQSLLSVWMIYSAVMSGFWAIMIVAWQYNENILKQIYKNVYGKEI